SILGTYDSLAPEQRGEGTGEIDQRTDIYSFGILLYRLLTGKRPAGRAKPASQATQGISKRWDSIVDRCLEYEAAARYESAEALLADIRWTTRRRLPLVVCALGVIILAAVVAGILLWPKDKAPPHEEKITGETPTVVEATVEKPAEDVRPPPEEPKAEPPVESEEVPAAPTVALADVVPVKSQAGIAWDKVKGLDRGQGFGELLDEADAMRRSAETFYAEKVYAEAKSSYEDLSGRCKTLVALEGKRKAALSVRDEAVTAGEAARS
ncbi:MAG: hypothetical protein QF662_09470, partial [Phycisphaerae bacterium]|nr:hypothetical protein [Phycisphaerae bacterium]